MQVFISRHKSGAIHHAKRVAANGYVAEWVSDPDKAVSVRDDDADKVAKFYDGRVNGGTIHFTKADGTTYRPPVHGSEPPKPKLKPSEKIKETAGEVSITAERDEYRRQAITLADEKESLTEKIEELKQSIAALEKLVAETKAEAEANQQALRAEIATLQKEKGELEQLIATAK